MSRKRAFSLFVFLMVVTFCSLGAAVQAAEAVHKRVQAFTHVQGLSFSTLLISWAEPFMGHLAYVVAINNTAMNIESMYLFK